MTDGNPPARLMTTMAKMAEMVPMGLRYAVHASAAASQCEGTTYIIIGRKISRERGHLGCSKASIRRCIREAGVSVSKYFLTDRLLAIIP